MDSPGLRLHSFKVEDALWDDCARIAADRGETVSAVIRRAMHVYALEHRRWP